LVTLFPIPVVVYEPSATDFRVGPPPLFSSGWEHAAKPISSAKTHRAAHSLNPVRALPSFFIILLLSKKIYYPQGKSCKYLSKFVMYLIVMKNRVNWGELDGEQNGGGGVRKSTDVQPKAWHFLRFYGIIIAYGKKKSMIFVKMR
jgi:hypothetical protein